jgi:hypothetical protein
VAPRTRQPTTPGPGLRRRRMQWRWRNKWHSGPATGSTWDRFYEYPFRPGLPDGFFSDQKSQLGYILEHLGIAVLYSCRLRVLCDHWVYFYGHLVIFVDIWDIFPCFGILS